MKPLVYWCRWHNARLRLHGRDAQSVWGELAFPDTLARFRFDLSQAILTIEDGPHAGAHSLDEMGVEIKTERPNH